VILNFYVLMSIVIIKPGILDTIQDTGRTGQGSYGINPGGAMDRFAAMLANILSGNNVNEAVMEIHYPGPQILFEQDALICITGADFTAGLNDEPLPSWQPVLIRKNTVLQFPFSKKGARAYLAVQGGFLIDSWLNSYSTNLKAGVGGWKGRRLEKGDELFFRQSEKCVSSLFKSENNFQVLRWRANIRKVYEQPNEISYIKGYEWDELSSESKEALTQSNFIIRSSSDRMGYQLKGNSLHLNERKEMVSCAVSFGTMQLLPNGKLVVLMADHQTTGGYPRIGHVISSHLPKLAQLRAGDNIQFKAIGITEAEEQLFFRQHEIHIWQRGCAENLNRVYAECRS
jgi:antagonist of KipI